MLNHPEKCFENNTCGSNDSLFLYLFQLKDMAERLPPGVYDAEKMRSVHLSNGLESNGAYHLNMNGERHSRSDSLSSYSCASPTASDAAAWQGSYGTAHSSRELSGTNVSILQQDRIDSRDSRMPNSGGAQPVSSSASTTAIGKESGSLQDGDNNSRTKASAPVNATQVEAEWIEQYEPGVYITLVALRDGTRDLKRVRFR